MLFTGQYRRGLNRSKLLLTYAIAHSCNNEQRLCLGATSIDYGYTNDYNCWYSICDPILRHTPTLAPLSSITAPYEVGFCSTAKAACRAMSGSRSLCAIDYTSGEPTTSVSDCLCAPPVLSLEYTCSFLGNISCIQVPAHFTSMSGWTYCDNFADVLTVPPSVVSPSQSSKKRANSTYLSFVNRQQHKVPQRILGGHITRLVVRQALRYLLPRSQRHHQRQRRRAMVPACWLYLMHTSY